MSCNLTEWNYKINVFKKSRVQRDSNQKCSRQRLGYTFSLYDVSTNMNIVRLTTTFISYSMKPQKATARYIKLWIRN